jgi:amino acid adenylation domain-containing protein
MDGKTMDTISNGIAIIGMSGRYPGAENLDRFWENLVAGVESISFFSDEELAATGLNVAELKKESNYVAARGIVKDADMLDAAFFNISPKEAAVIDPQQRLFLEASWQALEDAGIDPTRAKTYVGVFAGMTVKTYSDALATRPGLARPGDKKQAELADRDYLATRVAYKLNLKGPALSIHTACSTSLVAVAQACQALLCYQCDVALAGGVSVTFPQKRAYIPDGGMFSLDGHCRPFDAQAAGTNFSDGLGVVALKRLDEALNDGDQIYAVIRGFGINNDGSAKVGFAAPSVDGQAEVIALALGQAGVESDSISYIEAHGTATPLGDPIEIAALTQAFRSGTTRKNYCAIGSVKGNIGHLDAAAGVTGLIKTALALKHKQIPPTVHFTEPNPKIDFANSPFYVNAKLSEWKSGPTPRRAGVSGFGVGGTNVHIVLEEAPQVQPSGPSRDWKLLPISARTSSALESATTNLLEHLKANPGVNLADVSYTLDTRRRAFDHRRMLVCRDVADAIQTLQARSPKRVFTHEGKVQERPIAFMFPGQGAQYVNMGAELYRTEQAFKEEIDRCAAILTPLIGLDLRQVLYPAPGRVEAAEELLIQTRNTQPALFVIEYALARLWMSWGIKPRAMIGHSVGEYVAACLAGVFSLEDALRIVAVRAQLVQAQPAGAMLAVRLPENEVTPLLNNQLSIAAVNSTSLCVVSGPFDAVAELEAKLKTQGVAARRLQTSHAFHSAMMDPVLQPLTELLKKIRFNKPSIRYVSNVTGRWITESEATDPTYWANHVRQAVRFADGVGEIFKDGETILLEVGPGLTLASLAGQHPAKTASHTVISSFSAVKEEEVSAVLAALGKLWMAGTPIDWAAVHGNERRLHVALPTYPFERKRFWIEPPSPYAEQGSIERAGLNAGDDVSDNAIGLIESAASPSTLEVAATATALRKTRILADLTSIFQEISSANLSEVGPSATFMEMGLDSLFLGQAGQTIEKQFGVKITFQQFLQDVTTLNELAEYLDQKMAPDAMQAPAAPAPIATSHVSAAPAQAPVPASANPTLAAIQAQVEALTRQLELLRQAPSAEPQILPPQAVEVANTEAEKDRHIPRRTNADAYPLSPGQQRMWILDQFEKGTHYNEDFNLRLKGTVDVPVLKRAIEEIMRRHEAMRATFTLVGDELLQKLLPAKPMQFPVIDLTLIPESRREVEARRIAQEEARKPFDLSQGPLWRFTFLSLADGDSILLITAHHIAVDGWSFRIFRRELFALYEAFRAGKPSPLAEPAIQYSDYAAWQTEWLKGEAANQQRTYWTQHLAGVPQLLELPSDRPRPSKQTFRGSRISVVLPKQLTSDLKAASAREGVTLFMTLLAAFDTLLKGYTDKDDIVIGTPVANRTHAEVAGAIGFFVNTLVLRNDLSGDPTFRELLQRVRKTTLGGLANQGLPFEDLVDLLHPERSESYNPLFQVLIVFMNASNPAADTNSFSASYFEIENPTSKLDLSLYISDRPQGLSCVFEYSTDLFNADRIERMAQHLRVLLEAVVRNPAQRLSELPVITAEEEHRLLAKWNDTKVAYPSNARLHELFEAQAKKTPDAVALQFGGQEMTYSVLDNSANQLAHHLVTLGIGPEVLVGVCLERSIDMVVGVLAILKAGGAYVPLDPSFPQARLSHMVEDSKMTVLLTHRGLEEQLEVVPQAIVRLDSDWDEIAKLSADSAGLPTAGSDSRAYVLYTSGSTGKPKGVEISHKAIVNFLLSMQREPGFTADDILLAVTTLSFDIAGLELYLPLITGGRVVIASREDTHDPSRLMKHLREAEITVMQATPATWRGLIQAGWTGTPNLKVLCGGEALPSDLAEELLSRCGELWNMYGPTETTVWSTVHKVTSGAGSVPIGHPIANTQLYVLNAQRGLTPQGVSGELYIGGDGLARGYLHRPELTEERFVPSPFEPGARLYRTGDLARWLSDGTVECLGRVDNQVKIRGFRIELGEIETRLADYPGVRQAAVITREDTPGDKRLVAYYVASQTEEINSELLRTYLSSALPEYMVPAAYVHMDAFPQTPNGKLDRKALPEPEASAFSTREYEPPQTEMEIKVAAIWADILKLDRVGRQDNFFDLGGHSLVAVRVMLRLQQFVPGDVLPLRALLEAPTLERFAAWIHNHRPTQQPLLLHIRPGAPQRMPLFCAHGAGGHAMSMRPLAKALPADLPIYFFEARGLDGSKPFETVEETALCYVEEVRKVQPHGPYQLCGGCYGGMVAFEMARILEGQGESVRGLFLIDSYNNAFVKFLPKSELFLRHARFYARRFALHSGRMFLLNAGMWPGYIRNRLKALKKHFGYLVEQTTKVQANNLPVNLDEAGVEPISVSRFEETLVRVTRASHKAAKKFVPKPYGGSVVVFRASDRRVSPYEDDFLGWGPVVRGAIEGIEIEGTHTGILEEPAVRDLAERIDAKLRESSPEAVEAPLSYPAAS